TDREVEPAGDKDERPGGGDDQRRRLLVEDVEQIRRRREGRARQRQHREQDQERDQDAGAAGPRIAEVHAARPLGSSANAAASTAPSVIASPSSRATMRLRRITSTRCERPRISSSSDEITL